MAGRDIAGARAVLGRIRIAVVAHQRRAERLDRGVVEQRQVGIGLRLPQVLPARVEVGALHVAGPAHAHVVPAVGVETAEGEQQVVVAGAARVQDVGRLDAGVVAAREVDAVALSGLRVAGRGVEVEQEDPAGVGAVDQAMVPVGVDEGVRVDRVGVDEGVVDLAVLAGLVPHARAQEDALVAVRPLDVVGDRGAHRGARGGALAGAVVHAEAAVGGLADVGRPEGLAARPGEGLGELLGDILEQRVLVADQVGDPLPVQQVLAAGGGEVRSEHVESGVRDDHGRVVHRDLGELRCRRRLRSRWGGVRPAGAQGGAPGGGGQCGGRGEQAAARDGSHAQLLRRAPRGSWSAPGRPRPVGARGSRGRGDAGLRCRRCRWWRCP